MDVWEKEYNSEDIREAEFKALVNHENSEPVEEIQVGDHENSEKLGADLDPFSEREPSLDLTKPGESLSEEFTQAKENLVQIEQSLDESYGDDVGSMSKGIDSWLGQNDFSEPSPDQVSKGVEPALDENNEVSSFLMDALSKETPFPDSVAVDLVSNQLITRVPKSEDVGAVEDSDVPEVPHSTEHKTYMDATPRISWRDCCGLFQILRRSDQ